MNSPIKEPQHELEANSTIVSVSSGSGQMQNEATKPEIAESILGPIDMVDDTKGYCTCPGEHLHGQRTGSKDCMIYLDGVPTVWCLHSSCANPVAEANKEIRSALEGTTKISGQRKKPQADPQRQHEQRIRKRARSQKERIMSQYEWPLSDILADSPVSCPNDPPQQTESLLSCFDPNDTLWIGTLYDSGQEHHRGNFRRASEWIERHRQDSLEGPFICPSTFAPGSIQRSKDNIAAPRFLVVESDELSKDEVGAVFKWLRDAGGWKLEAVVDTGGKSLHAWFKYPENNDLEEAKLVLPELGCDPKLFNPAQPVRLPGVMRKEKNNLQTLIYLDSEVNR